MTLTLYYFFIYKLCYFN